MANNTLSDYKIKKIIKYFCSDLDATKTSVLLNINRNTVNKYFTEFRKCIYYSQRQKLEAISNNLDYSKDYVDSIYYTNQSEELNEKKLVAIIENNSELYIYQPKDFYYDFSNTVKSGIEYVERKISENVKTYYKGIKSHKYLNYISFSNVEKSSTSKFLTYIKKRLEKFNGVTKYYTIHLKECEWRWNKTQDMMEKELWEMYKQYYINK